MISLIQKLFNTITGSDDKGNKKTSSTISEVRPPAQQSYTNGLPNCYVCIDTETTGLNRDLDRIVEIAGVRVEDGVITAKYSSFIKSPVPISAQAQKVNGITDKMLKNAPAEDKVIREFLVFCGDLPFVGHNVLFDLDFLKNAVYRCGLFRHQTWKYYDTLQMAVTIMPDKAGLKLSDVATYFHIPQMVAHRALADAETTMQCYETMKRLIVPELAKQENTEEPQQTSLPQMRPVDSQAFLSQMKPTVSVINPNNPIYGKRIALSGNLKQMDRMEAYQFIVNHGGIPSNSVTKKTAYLVIGDDDYFKEHPNYKTTKMKKAEEWREKGETIIDIQEKDFFRMINDFEKQNLDNKE